MLFFLNLYNYYEITGIPNKIQDVKENEITMTKVVRGLWKWNTSAYNLLSISSVGKEVRDEFVIGLLIFFSGVYYTYLYRVYSEKTRKVTPFDLCSNSIFKLYAISDWFYAIYKCITIFLLNGTCRLQCVNYVFSLLTAHSNTIGNVSI
jgi:hypothetical protein